MTSSGIYDDPKDCYYTGCGVQNKIMFDPLIYSGGSRIRLGSGSENWLLEKARSARDSVKEKAISLKDRLKAMRAHGYGGRVFMPHPRPRSKPKSKTKSGRGAASKIAWSCSSGEGGSYDDIYGGAKRAWGYCRGGSYDDIYGGAKRAWGYSSRGGSNSSSLIPRYGTRGYHGYGFPTYGDVDDAIYGNGIGKKFLSGLANVGKNALTGVLQGFLG